MEVYLKYMAIKRFKVLAMDLLEPFGNSENINLHLPKEKLIDLIWQLRQRMPPYFHLRVDNYLYTIFLFIK